MGKAKRRTKRHRIERIDYIDDTVNRKESKFAKIKPYISGRWFKPTMKNVLIMTITFFFVSFVIAFPIGILINDYNLVYIVAHTFLTSFIIVKTNNMEERKAVNNIEFIVRWIMVGVILLVITYFSVVR